MNVLIVTNMYPSEKNLFYGIFVKEQVDSLRAAGVQIDVFFVNGKENRLNYVKSIIGLSKMIKRKHYDIIHSHHSYCIFLIRIAKVLSCTKSIVILTFHEGEVHRCNDIRLNDIDLIKRLVFSKRLKRLALKLVDLVITVQEDMLKKLNFDGKSIILPCGVNSEIFRPMGKKWCREKLSLPFDKKIIFFPASPTNEQKGFDILKESMNYFFRKDIYLIASGNIKHEEMTYYMSASDVVVQLSIFEASSSVLKEALAVNVPVVFTDVGDTKTIIGNAKGCFLCGRESKDVALKLEKALNFDGRCDGRKRILESKLTLKANTKKMIRIYNELLA